MGSLSDWGGARVLRTKSRVSDTGEDRRGANMTSYPEH